MRLSSSNKGSKNTFLGERCNGSNHQMSQKTFFFFSGDNIMSLGDKEEHYNLRNKKSMFPVKEKYIFPPITDSHKI